MSDQPARPNQSDEPPLLKVRGPADLAQLVPYLMGFHPSRSLVVVGLANRRVQISARLDLDDLHDDDADSRLAATLLAMVGSGVQSFVGIVYDDEALPFGRPDDDELPWAGIAAVLDAEVARVGCELDDIALVSAGRIYSFVCRVPACCPPEGTVLDGASTAAAEATYAGLVALPDRESLAALLDPAPDVERDALRPALQHAEDEAIEAILRGDGPRRDRSAKRALLAAARRVDGADGSTVSAAGPLNDDQLIDFAVSLQRRDVRDAIWLAIDEGRIDGRPLWRAMAHRLPAPFDAAPLFLFAWMCYRDGDGALAGIAAERALESDPRYNAADLVVAALAHAIDPRQMPKLRGAFSRRRKRARAGAPHGVLRALSGAGPHDATADGLAPRVRGEPRGELPGPAAPRHR